MRPLAEDQLERILASEAFSHADRVSNLLAYLVNATFDPSRNSVTQHDIAIDVYERDANFDPTIDSLVRVEVSRLRSKLTAYYADEGKRDRLIIELPKGSYGATFEVREHETGEESSLPSRRFGSVAIFAVVAVLAALVWFTVYAGRNSDSEIDASGVQNLVPTIAVLPFTDMSEAADQSHFSDGISEDIITDLSVFSGLKVISRTSSFTYKDGTIGVGEIASELNATHVLEGSVRRAGDTIRITAQLIEAETEAHLWAERYDVDAGQIFEVQDDVTRRIVSSLKIVMLDSEAERLGSRPTIDLQAYDQFLKAKEQLYRFDEAGILLSIDLLSDVISSETEFAEALAWRSRALTYAYLVGFIRKPEDSLDLALIDARRAVELEPNLSIAHANLGWTLRWKEQFPQALESIQHAIDLNPNYAEAFLWQSLTLTSSGNGAEAIRVMEQGIRLNPNYGVTTIFALGFAHHRIKQFDTALDYFDRGIERKPEFLPNHIYRLDILERMEDLEAIKQERATLESINPNYKQSASYRFYLESLENAERGAVSQPT